MQTILIRLSRVLLVSLPPLLLVCRIPAHADIFQWEYINPADPSQGKQQSTTLAPDGAGVDAVRGTNLFGRNLTMAYLTDSDLSPLPCPIVFCSWVTTNLSGTNLTNADLTSANLSWAYLWNTNLRGANVSNADFSYATLTNADFTGADVRGARFGWPRSGYGTGISLAQLYSTASYQARDLSGINLSHNYLAGGNFVGQNLTNADFSQAVLTDADFAGAEVRGAFFGNAITLAQLYSTASYQAHDLSGINLNWANLTGGNFAGFNLTNAVLSIFLDDADFTEAEVRGATLRGITLAQLYSTASYQAKDLSGTSLLGNFAGGNFAGFNLTNADLGFEITDADFTQAEVRGATLRGITLAQLYSTASYQTKDLSAIGLSYNDLTAGNFAGQNLTNASFVGTALTDADFTNAVVQGVDFGIEFGGSGVTLAQLYSTASYEDKDLSSISLDWNSLAGGNFAGFNLTNAQFRFADLTGAVFCQANLTNASLDGATLSGSDFTAADARGSDLCDGCYYAADAITTNLIWRDGHISGLVLDAGGLLLVRDYDGFSGDYYGSYRGPIPPTPITVDEHVAIGPGGTLRMVFEADAWDSTISFAPGIPVTLGGTLELTFTDDVNLASQVGRTFNLFDWTGVHPTGTFAVSSLYAWDLSNLYTTGEIALTAVPEPRALVLFSCAFAALVPIGRLRHYPCSGIGENE